MGAMASQITGVSTVYSTACTGVNQRKNVKAPGHWTLWGEPPVTGGSPDKGPVTRKMFSFDELIIANSHFSPKTEIILEYIIQTNVILPVSFFGNITFQHWNTLFLRSGTTHIYPYPLGLVRWHLINHTTIPVPEKWRWQIWVNASNDATRKR